MKKYLLFIFALCFMLTSCFFNDVENAESGNPPTTPATDYLLTYNFDETSGTTALDSSGNGFYGTLFSAVRTDGKVNRAVSFPSENSLVLINFTVDNFYFLPLNNNLGSLTIYSWIKLNELNLTKEYIILRGYWLDEYLSIEIINKHLTILFSNTPYLQSTTTLQPDQWIHFVLTSDGNIIALYLNGQIDCSVNSTFPTSNNNEILYSIGGSDTGNSCLGVIDEFNIMKIALTATQVQELYSKY
jgi:hypothetical protein